MSDLAKIVSLSYDSASATITSALKTYYRSVRLIKNSGTINPTQDSKYTNILLCGNCVDPSTRNLYVFYIDMFFNAAWIIEINIDSRVQTVVYYDKYNKIDFDPLHKIYNPRVVYGRIIWTDNKNPIYQMDVNRAKQSFKLGIGYGQNEIMAEWSAITNYASGRIVSNGNNFYEALSYNSGIEPRLDSGTTWKKLCLIEDAYYSMNIENFYFEAMPPKHPPEVTYQSDDSRKVNNLRQTLFQCAYRYVYMDWRRSTFSPASIVPVPQAEEETATGLANEQISLNNKLQIVFNSGGEEVRAIEIIGRSSQDPSKWFLIDTIYKFSVQERGNEISKTTETSNIIFNISVMSPTVISTSAPEPDGTIGISMAIMPPLVSNSYVAFSVTGMDWDADQYDVSVKKSTTVTLVGIHQATIQTIPSWIAIVDNNTSGRLSEGDTIIDGMLIGIYPSVMNAGDERTGSVILSNQYGDTASVNVIQYAAIPPPSVSLIVDTPNTSGLSLSGSGTAINNSTNVIMIFTPGNNNYVYGGAMDLSWRATINGIASGDGSFSVFNKVSNTHTIIMSSNAVSGDIIIVYLSMAGMQQ